MRALKTSERRLALAFGALIFLVANFLVLGVLQDKRRAMEIDLRNLQLEQTESAFWLGQKDLWTKRQAWLNEKQPKLSGTGQESGDLLQSLQQSARQEKIVISNQTFPELTISSYFREAAVQLEIKGSLESISRWIATLQNPEAFQAITSLNLKSDAEAPNVICTLTIARWYALP